MDTTYTSGDKITISGTAHNGTAWPDQFRNHTDLRRSVDLLNQIQSLFGNVTASLTSTGQIQVIDNATGTSDLSVNLQASLQILTQAN